MLWVRATSDEPKVDDVAELDKKDQFLAMEFPEEVDELEGETEHSIGHFTSASGLGRDVVFSSVLVW